ncbi:metal-dependent hydrolase [Methylomonas sp. MgM2]
MPTFISHTAVPIAIANVAGKRKVPNRLLKAAVAASVIPDLDIVGAAFGIPFEHAMGHRGFLHSPVFGLALALTSLGVWRKLGPSKSMVFGVISLSAMSHGLLDAATHGGIGVAFLSPFSNERFLLPWRPIPAVPTELTQMIGLEGLAVVAAEIMWIWIPCLIIIMCFRLLRRKAALNQTHTGKTKTRFFNPASAWRIREAKRAKPA